jgi:RHS repeat-associated protein
MRYERDDLDRVVARDAGGAVTTFAYDFFDQLAEATGPDATISYLRDRYGRLKSETVNGRTLTYGHDTVGRRVSRTTPSGAVSTWAYDAAGRRSTLTTSGRVFTFDRDAAGRERARHIGGTLTLESSFDTLGRLTTQQATSGNRSVQRRDYAYRADGNLIGIDDQLSGARHFDLDTTGRVTAVHAANWTERYAYDEAGNQTDASWPAAHPGQEATGARSYTGTTITRAGNVRYEHDALGRITLRQKTRLSRKPDTWRYTWDAEDHLTSVTTPDGVTWRYLYDPLGRRTAKHRMSADGRTVLEKVDFVWDGTTLCEQTAQSDTASNPVTLTWDHLGLHPIAQTERLAPAHAPQEEIDQRFFSIITDLVGAPTELIDEQGDIAWRTRTTLWGTTTWNSDAKAHTPLRFPGQYHDPESGLHYNFHRYYDPETARYLTPDPLGLAPAPNPAVYVGNPHSQSDPFGLAPYRNAADPQDRTGTAPRFISEPAGEMQDVGKMGRPDDQFVYSGHGGIMAGDGMAVAIPKGTYVSMYSQHGETISDWLGNQIERGTSHANPVEVYGPGEKLPDYTLFPPEGLHIQGVPKNLTVDSPYYLSQLLRPNMGMVHWAACRSVILN